MCSPSVAEERRRQVRRAARSILSLAPAVSSESALACEIEDAGRAAERGYFTPDEDERLRECFGRYLATRAGLLETVAEIRALLEHTAELDERTRLEAFVVGYTASALLVRAGRFVVERYAASPIVRRKLDEAEPSFGIPRKEFTRIFKSLTHPRHAILLREALHFADAHRQQLETLADDSELAEVLEILRAAEDWLRVGAADYLRARLRYRLYSLRRRRASSFEKAMFAFFEGGGRIVSELRLSRGRKRVDAVCEQIAELLAPGDVLITRHDLALSNLFLPGYWPHAALYLGSRGDFSDTELTGEGSQLDRWREPLRVLEARKDGVRLRPLAETLQVDAVAVIRPRLDRDQIAAGLCRALQHEGKLYDFEFDFCRSDRLVCTEVVYRAFHGIGPLAFELRERAGRRTLSAEDLLGLAVEGRIFEPVAVFGPDLCAGRVITGEAVRAIIAATCAPERERK